MKPFAFFLLSVLFTLSGCNKDLDIEKGTPGCVKSRIKTFNKETECKSAEVKEYLFQGKTVFVFDLQLCCCDQASKVIDSECNELGYLNGISGNQEINGANFSSAQFVKTVWKK